MKKTILSMLLAVMAVGLSAVFTSCSSDDDNRQQNVDVKPISMYIGDSHSITMNFTPKFIVSGNNFVATADNSGNVKGVHVGSTNISIDSRFTIPVEIKGKRKTYDDPITEWGCNQSYIKSKQKQGTLKEVNGTLGYLNCGKADLVGYMFKNEKLAAVGVSYILPKSPNI